MARPTIANIVKGYYVGKDFNHKKGENVFSGTSDHSYKICDRPEGNSIVY